MVFATTYHDSGYREHREGTPPMNVKKGRPYAHREDVPNFEAVELNAYAKVVDWLSLARPLCRAVGLHAPYRTVAQPLQYFHGAGRPVARAKPARAKRQKSVGGQASRGQKSACPPKLPASKTSSPYNYAGAARSSICCRCTSAFATATLRTVSSRNTRFAPVRVSYDKGEARVKTDGPAQRRRLGGLRSLPPFDVSLR